MKPQKQQGVTAIEGLLILVILAIVGFTGWYVYHVRSNANANLTSAANTQVAVKAKAKKTAPELAPDPTADWQTIKSPDASYAFKAPPTWVSLTCPESGGGSPSAVYIASSKTNLAHCQSDNGGEANFSMMADQSAKSAPAKDPAYQSYSSAAATVNGISGFKTTYKTAADQALGGDTTYVVYSFLSGGKSFYATFVEFNVLPAGDLATFDQIVQTWKF